MNVKRNYLILCLTYFIIFFANALFLSFFQIFLVSKGFNESKVGIISSITPLLCIIANPLYSIIGNNNNKIRYLLLGLSILEAIVILLVYSVNEFSLIIFVMCLVAVIDPPLFVILDSYASSFVKENNKNYSYIRIIGTLAYALGAFTAGLMIEIKGYGLIFKSASILMLISVILIIFLKPNKLNEERKRGDISLLLKNKFFIIFSIYFIFILAFQSLGDTYISIYLTSERMIDESTFGVVNSLWVFIELLIVLILNKLKINNERMLLIIIGLCYLSRLFAIGLNVSNSVLIISALLRGVGMGINIYLYIPMINRMIKSSNISLALLMISMFKSLITTILISTTGFFIEKIGYNSTFIIWSILLTILIVGYYLFSKVIKENVN